VTRANRSLALLVLALLITSAPASAQTFPSNNRVIRNMWDQGMGAGSKMERIAQTLTDSIGPRLIASPGYYNAVDWAVKMYESWRIPVRKEQYGTWMSWRRGYTRVDLVAPRFRSLQGTMLAWSPGTSGPIEGDVVVLPDLPDAAAYDRWMAGISGKFVMIGPSEASCRPIDNLAELAKPETLERLGAQHDSLVMAWSSRYRRVGPGFGSRLEASGAAGVFASLWSQGWGVNKIQDSATLFGVNLARIPNLDLSCEDYGLLYRLAERQQGPRVRLDADSEPLGEQPVYNVVAEIRGTQLPNEYVVLSAHFDSWDSASGATDNGTGTLMMMEAMRILKATYPSPKRTIIVGHWGGEEQGQHGSGSFAADHPEVIAGLQVGFNQDNGTWRIDAVRMRGFTEAQENVARWLQNIPREIADTVMFESPVDEGGSDHESFNCYGVPFLRLQSANYPDYRQYTWHTNTDTFDKVILDDLRNNATLVAMLAYQASEDPRKLSRVRSPVDVRGRAFPTCSPPQRKSTG
jgi:carboxypeptidase Q